MGRSSRFTFEEKTKAVKAIISGESSINYQAALLNCNVSTVRKWVVKYKTFGFNGLKHIDKNKIYNIYTKVMAVKDYLSSDKSLEAIVIEYKIHEKEQLRNWVSLYNKGKLIKSGGLDSMRIKGTRKNLTLENRIKIVKYYLEISKDYSKTAIKFQVSYQQVYQWVQKYNKFGVNGLVDRRGKRKSETELSELEKLKLENKLLKAKNRRMELENAFLKKLNDLEGV